MEKLRNIVQKGILIDLLKAEQALSVYQAIAENATEINMLSNHIKSSLAYVQYLSINELLLSISRIYDKYNKRNPTRCIASALDFIDNNKSSIPPVREKYQVSTHLSKYGFPKELSNLIESENKSLFPAKFFLFCNLRIAELRNEIKLIKTNRDRKLTHNELSLVDPVSLDNIQTLIEFGWQVVIIIGWAFLNTCYGTVENYHIRGDGQKIGLRMKKLIRSVLENNGA